jgi:beta-lactamase regulating signal transducer with metallopeptidase domain
MIAMWIGAALRPLLLALAVGAGLRLFRVRNVLAIKSAWILVLMTAFLAPFAAFRPLATLVLPVTVPEPAARATTVPAAAMAAPRASNTTSLVSAAAPIVQSPAQTPRNSEADIAAPAPAHPALPASPPEQFSLLPVQQAPVAGALPSNTPSHSLGQIAAGLYFAVAAALLFRLLYGLIAALRLWRSAQPVGAGIEALGEGLRLRASAAINSPVTVGSAVLLPASHAEWDEEKLRIVLAHERSHVRQRDFYLQALAGFYAAMVWISPLGWWLKRRLSELGEALSDRSGLEVAGSRSIYAQILLEFAAAPRTTRIGVAMARSSNLSQRIERLFDDRAFRQAYTLNRRTLFVAILATVALCAATTLVQVEAATRASNQVAAPAAPPAPAAAPASQAEPPAPPDSKPAPGQISAPPVHVDVPAIHVNVPAVHVDQPAQTIDIPAVHVNIPEQHLNIPAIESEPAKTIDIPAIHVNVPAKHINVPAIHVDVPAIHLDVPAVHVDRPAIHIETPPAGKQDDSGGRASLGTTGELLAMLNGLPGFGQASMRPAAFARTAPAQNEATFDRTLTFTGSLDLHVANGSGNIHITRGTAGQVQVHARVHSNRASDAEEVRSIAANPPIEQNGSTIHIGGESHWQQGAHHISIDYEIAAPADAALSISSGSGNITDEGVGRQAKFNTGSGNIVASGTQGGFTAETGSGNIRVENSGQGDAKVETGSGNIEVSGVHGALVAQTGSGDIKAEGTPVNAWKLETGSGNIEFAPGNAPVTLDASAWSGKIAMDRAMTTQVSSDRHHLRAELNGGGASVRIETGSGNIRIR